MTSSRYWATSLLFLIACGTPPTLGTSVAEAGDTDETAPDEVGPQMEPPEHVHSPDCIHNRLATAEGAQEQVQVQEDIIEDQVQKTDDLNDELAVIIEKLRLEKGLPKVAPYVSPQQIESAAAAPPEEEDETGAEDTESPVDDVGEPLEMPMSAAPDEEAVVENPNPDGPQVEP